MRRAAVLAGLLLAAVLLWLATGDGAGRREDGIHAAIERSRLQVEQSQGARFISAADLPPAGTRSLFDHHVAQLDGLPYPFSALLDSFRSLDRWDNGSVSLLIPDGRSLRKGEAGFRQPRVLAAAQVQPPFSRHQISPIYSGRLFLGFVEAASEIEIIAYNEAAGRFEFQLVKDYCAGCVPRIVYTRRVVCLSCHQAAAPIFSVRPWAETNGQMAIARQIAGARGIAWADASTTRYHGATLSTQQLAPETYDELVGFGGDVVLAQRIWIDGCGPAGNDCRRQLLAQALFRLLAPGAFHPDSAASEELRLLQQARWPTQGIAAPDNSIPSRDPLREQPLLQRLLGGLTTVRLPTLGDDDDNAAFGEELAAKLAAFERAPRLAPELDPLSLRPPSAILQADSLQGVDLIAAMFSANDRRLLLQWSAEQPDRIRQMVRNGRLDRLLGPDPLNRVAVLQALATQFGVPAPDYCCLDTSRLSPPRGEDAQPLAITQGSVLEVFRRYCFACHRGNPSARLDFMGADSEAQVLATIAETAEIRERLDYARYRGTRREDQLMPPAGSLQRQALEEALRQDDAALERMRGAVRPLFEF